MNKGINLTVDRIVDGVATFIGDDECVYHINTADFPADIAEGDIWLATISDGALVSLTKNEAEMSERAGRIEKLFDKLKNKSNNGKENDTDEN